jgi:voltage-gated potassium channel
MVSVGVVDDPINGAYDIVSTLALLVNLTAAFAATYDNIYAAIGPALDRIEAVTVAFFALDYVLRLLTANNLYPDLPEGKSLLRYVFSFSGIVDLLSFLPYYLPFFFPTGAVVFRLFRIARIFRLFRINAYYDSLNVITEVVVGKRQ